MHHSFSKLEMILTLMITRAKRIEIGEIHFYNTFECIWFKCVFGPKNYEFEDVTLAKIIQFYVIKKHECVIYVI